jgi:hypothetical protein
MATLFDKYVRSAYHYAEGERFSEETFSLVTHALPQGG